jgi:hypothetical protein
LLNYDTLLEQKGKNFLLLLMEREQGVGVAEGAWSKPMQNYSG